MESSLAHTLRRLGCRSDNPLEWKPSWDWERELSDELMIEAYLKAKWRCGVETDTTAGWEESEKGPLRPEAWRTTERRKRVLGPLLFETIRHGWNNSGLACDFARNLAKHSHSPLPSPVLDDLLDWHFSIFHERCHPNPQ